MKISRKTPGYKTFSSSLGKPVCPVPFPPEMWVTFRYSTDVSAAASVNFYQYVWNLNSCYDPDYTGFGTQPFGFDEWSNIYKRYVVVETTMSVRVSCRTTTSVCNSAIVFTSFPPTTGLTFDVAAGMPRSKWGMATYGAPPLVLKKREPTFLVQGVPPATILAEINYSAANTASPNTINYGALCIATTGASDALSFFTELKMKTKVYNSQLAVLSLDNGRRFKPSDAAALAPVPLSSATSLGDTVTSGPELPLTAADVLSSLSAALGDMAHRV
jgi:hypothetical protein